MRKGDITLKSNKGDKLLAVAAVAAAWMHFAG